MPTDQSPKREIARHWITRIIYQAIQNHTLQDDSITKAVDALVDAAIEETIARIRWTNEGSD